MIYRDCLRFDGDEDCNKCVKHGYIYSCPYNCPDYYGFWPWEKAEKMEEGET